MTKNRSFGIRFVLATMMALTVAVTGCKDDDGGGGTGGSGGTDIGCVEGRCVDDAQAATCEEEIRECIAQKPADEEKCIALGNFFFCNEGVLAPVFVTSEKYDGAFGNQSVYDNACSTAAGAGGLEGFWSAWLSTGTTDAEDRIIDAAKYVLVDGTVIADDKDDLLDGNLDAPIQVNEFGVTVLSDFEVWTGTDADGTNSAVGNCDDWIRNGSRDSGQSGRADAMGPTWTAAGEEDCDLFNRLYCFGKF